MRLDIEGNMPEIKPDIPKKQYQYIQQHAVIPTVDILPVKMSPTDPTKVEAVGLILRDTDDPKEGRKWVTIGGRLLHGELPYEAIARQLRETLGPDVRFVRDVEEQPTFVANYLSKSEARLELHAYDERQQALGLTFVKRVEGNIVPQGEAYEFKWFPADQLPDSDEFGFHQKSIVRITLSSFRERIKNLNRFLDEFIPVNLLYWETEPAWQERRMRFYGI